MAKSVLIHQNLTQKNSNKNTAIFYMQKKKEAFIIKLDKVNKQQCSLNEPSVRCSTQKMETRIQREVNEISPESLLNTVEFSRLQALFLLILTDKFPFTK